MCRVSLWNQKVGLGCLCSESSGSAGWVLQENHILQCPGLGKSSTSLCPGGSREGQEVGWVLLPWLCWEGQLRVQHIPAPLPSGLAHTPTVGPQEVDLQPWPVHCPEPAGHFPSPGAAVLLVWDKHCNPVRGRIPGSATHFLRCGGLS